MRFEKGEIDKWEIIDLWSYRREKPYHLHAGNV